MIQHTYAPPVVEKFYISVEEVSFFQSLMLVPPKA